MDGAEEDEKSCGVCAWLKKPKLLYREIPPDGLFTFFSQRQIGFQDGRR